MTGICFYFQVHQPFRLKKDFNYFSIGPNAHYEDDKLNSNIVRKVAEKCYLPTNKLILKLIDRYEGRFRVSYSITGLALEQFEYYAPEVLDSFQDLAQTGCVEFLAETYYHSLSSLFSESEFRSQIKSHQKKIQQLFGKKPKTFRNTELIYNNRIAKIAEELGFSTILAEGADRILGWRSPNYVYRPAGTERIQLLLKNYSLSDDVAFRFSNREWKGWPLTADRYARDLSLSVRGKHSVNLFMDYETFGEHQWADTGIFHFLERLPAEVFRSPGLQFLTPSEVSQSFPAISELDIPGIVSWADVERDVSAWLGNPLQDSAAEYIYSLEKQVLATKDVHLIHAWRKLQTSDHFYYMCIKYHNDGDVHKYFSPYQSPYDAYIQYLNAIHQLRWYMSTLTPTKKSSKEPRQKKKPAPKTSKQKASEIKLLTKAKRPAVASKASKRPKTLSRARSKGLSRSDLLTI